MRYQKLLSPIMIGGQIIKNRLTYPNASPHFLQGPETFPADGYRAFAANLAKNGAAIVNFAEWDNYPAQRQGPSQDHRHLLHCLSGGLQPLRRAGIRSPGQTHRAAAPGADG